MDDWAVTADLAAAMGLGPAGPELLADAPAGAGHGAVAPPLPRQRAVAEGVVRQESAGAQRDGAVAASRGCLALPARKATGAGDKRSGDESASDEPELVKQDGAAWPVFAKSGRPYLIEDRGGRPGFWAARDWILADPGLKAHTDKRSGRTAYLAPSRTREVLGAMGWVEPAKVEIAAAHLTFQFFGALSHFVVGAEAAFATGLPHGRQALVDRDRDGGLLVTLALDDEDLPPRRS